MSDRVRLSLDVSPQLNATLEDLARRMGGTKADVMRKAITLLEVAVTAKEAGHRIGVAADGHALTTEIVGLW